MDKIKYKLIRERDELTKLSKKITWIQWNDNGSYNSHHDEIKVGRSLLMSPHTIVYTWLTTPVVEIMIDTAAYKKFRTTNSVYELYLEVDDEGWDAYSDLPNPSFYETNRGEA